MNKTLSVNLKNNAEFDGFYQEYPAVGLEKSEADESCMAYIHFLPDGDIDGLLAVSIQDIQHEVHVDSSSMIS